MRTFFIIIVLLLFNNTSTFSQKDIKDSKDHPLLTRYPDAFISYYETVKFREYYLAHGPITGYRQIAKRDTLEGQLTRITYSIKKPAENLSIGEVYRDYRQAFEKADIKIMAKGSSFENKRGIGSASWIGLALGANAFPQGAAANYLFAGTSSAGGTYSIIGNVQQPQGRTYVAMYGERHSKDLVIIHVDIIELKDAETGKVSADANYIRQEIDAKGSVSIYGITFDFDSAKIRPESKAALKEIAKFLKDNPDVQLYVVGHTDMKGTLEYNLRLSKNRAKAVVDVLVAEHGIASSRLLSNGVAFLAPKASNNSEEGRAMNRRTELVKRGK